MAGFRTNAGRESGRRGNYSAGLGKNDAAALVTGLFATRTLSALDDRAVAYDRAVRGVIQHLAVEDAAILERQVNQVAILGWRLRLELHD
jgi:hypothetical protein